MRFKDILSLHSSDLFEQSVNIIRYTVTYLTFVTQSSLSPCRA